MKPILLGLLIVLPGTAVASPKAWVGRVGQKIARAKRQFSKQHAFASAFRAWARDPQIRTIYSEQKSAHGVRAQAFRHGVGVGLTTAMAVGTGWVVAHGGDPNFGFATTAIMSMMVPKSATESRQRAMMDTITQARASGHQVPEALLPMYHADLRMKRMDATRDLRRAEQGIAAAKSTLGSLGSQLEQVRSEIHGRSK